MSQQEFTSTPTSLKSADGPVAAVPSWRPRRRKIVWGALWLSLIVVSLWLFGVPSTLLKSQALRQLQRGRADQAMSWLMWARKLGGTDAELEFLTGRTYRILGDMNLTRSHLKTAWQLGYPVARLQREQTLAMAQSGQYRESEPALSGLLLDPRGDMTEICDAYVIGYIRTYRLSQADRLLKAWLADSPRQPRALLLRAKMQIDLLNWKSAEQDLREVLAAVPEHAEAADLLAGVFLKQKQPEAALQILPVAVKDRRTRLSARLREVECYRLQGQSEAARRLLPIILDEFPDSMQAHLDLGTLESDAGEFEPAARELERARELAPTSPDVRYALAIALRGCGRETEAKEHFEYVTRAREAVTEAMNLRSKVEQNPADAELRCQIGTAFLDYGQTERGLVWLQSALDVNPRLASAHERLARYYAIRAKDSEEFSKLAIAHHQLAAPP